MVNISLAVVPPSGGIYNPTCMSLPSYGNGTCKSSFHRKSSPASTSVLKGGSKYFKDTLPTTTTTAVAPGSDGVVVGGRHSLLLEVVPGRIEPTTSNKRRTRIICTKLRTMERVLDFTMDLYLGEHDH